MSELSRDLDLILKSPLRFSERWHETDGVRPRASVLALFSGPRFLDSEILLIKRSMHVATHAGQVAFPGGGVEEIDQGDFFRTALRETEEEVGIPAHALQALGELPSFPTPIGGFFVAPIVGFASLDARKCHLKPDPNEVAFAEWVSVSSLIQSRAEETRILRGVEMDVPYFWWKGEKMWGLTAMIFDLILKRYAKL